MKLIDLLVKELPKRGGWPDGVTHIEQDYDRELMFYGRGDVRTGVILNELAIDHRKCGEVGEKITREQYESALAASKAVVGNDGWIQWAGGGCPVDGVVDVKLRNGHITKKRMADSLDWNHYKPDGDGAIIAYRLHNPEINSRANDDRLEQDLNECIGQDVDMPEWNGEGLPPVGCECELKYKCHDDDAYWERVVILWQRGDDTLVEYVGDHFKNTTQLIHKTSMHVDFRPLRTEADKKRDEVINEIASMIGRGTFYEDAERIYDAIAAGKIPGVKLEEK